MINQTGKLSKYSQNSNENPRAKTEISTKFWADSSLPDILHHQDLTSPTSISDMGFCFDDNLYHQSGGHLPVFLSFPMKTLGWKLKLQGSFSNHFQNSWYSASTFHPTSLKVIQNINQTGMIKILLLCNNLLLNLDLVPVESSLLSRSCLWLKSPRSQKES